MDSPDTVVDLAKIATIVERVDWAGAVAGSDGDREAPISGIAPYALDREEIADVIALAWAGRGDFEPGAWRVVRLLAAECGGIRGSHYPRRMPGMGGHLRAGLAKLAH
jgi:hypothetical protein